MSTGIGQEPVEWDTTVKKLCILQAGDTGVAQGPERSVEERWRPLADKLSGRVGGIITCDSLFYILIILILILLPIFNSPSFRPKET